MSEPTMTRKDVGAILMELAESDSWEGLDYHCCGCGGEALAEVSRVLKRFAEKLINDEPKREANR